jgi:hypothetical protein
MEWRTELQVRPAKNKISLAHKIFTIGSCFSDEIGQRLLENKFTVSKNPFGTVYNPVSIHELLCLGLNNELPDIESYASNGDIHFNYHFHSLFSSLKRNDLEERIRKSIHESNNFLSGADRIIITYGTALVFYLKGTQKVVANCHKMPPVNFEKRLLTEAEIVKSFEGLYSRLKSANAAAKIILTVSPVRHLKDTLELNSVSKSILRTACHCLTNRFSDVEYFPAYEILLDDLRDYRFYKSDLLHPSEEAVEYIWEKFFNAYFDEPAKKFITEWKKIMTSLAHKPFQPRSESHVKFLKSVLSELEKWETLVDVSKERSEVIQRIRESSEQKTN